MPLTPTTNNTAAYFNYNPTAPGIGQFTAAATQQYNAFTGADLTAYFGNKVVGKLQGITCSIQREVMPIYTTGDPNPKAFPKGKRGIAGNIIFTQFDKHAILRDLIDTSNQTLQNIWDSIYGTGASALDASISKGGQILTAGQAQTATSPGINPALYTALQSTQSNANAARQDALQTLYLVANRKLNYVDMIPPFDVVITLVNEAGNMATVTINGVQLINEAWGYSLEDMHSEAAFTYVARAVTPLTSLDPTSLSGTSSN